MHANVLRIAIVTGLALAFLVGIPDADAGEIKYVGSSTVGKFMNDAQSAYTDSTFSLNTKPESGGGENATAAGKTDIGGVAREVKEQILAKGVNKYLIGHDAIGVLVNSKNPVSDLSTAQLKDIFTGQVHNWSQVGGKDMAITVYVTNTQSATRKVFAKKVLGGADYGGPRIKTIRPDPAIAAKVADDEGGIGQLSFALMGNSSGIKLINPDGQTASVDNSAYPITRPLYLITKGEPQGEVRLFIRWALSDAGQTVLKNSFVGAGTPANLAP